MSILKHPTADRTGADGTGGGMTALEARVAKVEADVGHIQSDIGEIKNDLRTLLKGGIAAFLITWAGLIAVALGLAFLMAKGFGWIK